MDEAIFWRRPDVGRWSLIEDLFIACEGLRIPIVELGTLRLPPLGGAVMKVEIEEIPAEVEPIAAGVNKVEVPDLIDFLGRRDRVSGKDG